MGFESNTGTNSTNHYGPRDTNMKFGGDVSSRDGVRKAVYEFSYDDLPTEGTGNLEAVIPADSFIVSARLHVMTAFTGGTSYNLGLYQSNGTVIDADGIDAGVLTAALTEDAWIDCDGALVGAGVGGADGELRVAATGTFTAGKAKLEIEYIKPVEASYSGPAGT